MADTRPEVGRMFRDPRKILLVAALLLSGCTGDKNFWTYVVDDSAEHRLPERQSARESAEAAPSSPYNIKVVTQDGSVIKETIIPILTSGQVVLIEPETA